MGRATCPTASAIVMMMQTVIKFVFVFVIKFVFVFVPTLITLPLNPHFFPSPSTQ
jgi:hypothetical protein